MATKKNIDLELADKFYEGVQEYVAKLEKTRSAIEKNKASMIEQYADYDMDAFAALEQVGVKLEDDSMSSELKQHNNAAAAVAKLQEQEKKHLANKELLEKNIKVAIAKYIAQTEQDIVKAQKNIDNYEKYIKEEQGKLATLEQEIKALEGNEELAEVLKDKKEDYEALKVKIEERLKKLDGYNKDLEELKADLERNKEKYKDYVELANKDITEPEDKEKTEKAKEPEKKEKEDKDKEAKKDEKKEPEGNRKEEKVYNGVATGPVVTGDEGGTEPSEEKEPETDEQAFNRIYKLLSKRKTRDSVTNEDIDKMIEILSDKENYSKLNIGTRRFLDLGIFPSKAEKIYKQLGKKLSYDVYKVTKNKEVLSASNIAEFAKWENINELGVKIDEKTEAEIALDNALTSASDADKEQIVEVKNRFEKYRQSMVTLDEVMFGRGELQFVSKELPEGKEEVVEHKDVEVMEADEKGIFADLGSAVKTEFSEPTSKESPSKTEKVVSDGHDAI